MISSEIRAPVSNPHPHPSKKIEALGAADGEIKVQTATTSPAAAPS
jgi:hypothetical protein